MMTIQKQVPKTFPAAKEMSYDKARGKHLLLRSAIVANHILASMMVTMFEGMHWVVDNQSTCLLFSYEANPG